MEHHSHEARREKRNRQAARVHILSHESELTDPNDIPNMASSLLGGRDAVAKAKT